MRGKRIQIPLKMGHHWPPRVTPFKWRFAGGPMMTQHKTLNARLEDLYFFRGSGTVLPINPIYLSLSRGVRSPVPFSGSEHAKGDG